MYVVKSLKLHGFKTFPKETVIDFSKGITAIIGPNGSGKSNIAEAIIWVMGEQSPKAFRSGQMEDVIFSGTDKLAPMGMAEVVLKLENLNAQKGEERYIEILRRFYRSGEGEYRLNGKRVRRKDIQEFLYDIGMGSKSFAMIEQGKVSQLIEAKPEERRYFIEEAAGILKYKLKRKEAESKIKLTRENLERVEDIIAEVKKNLNSLRQQAARARQFSKLQSELNEIEAKIVADKIFSIEHETEKLNKEITSFSDKIIEISAEISKIQSHIESKKSEILERENDLALLNKDFFEKKLKSERIETEIKHTTEHLEGLRKRIENYHNEIENFEKELENLTGNEKREKENKALVSEDIETLQLKKEELKSMLDSLKRELREKEDEFAEFDRELKQFETENYKLSSELNYLKKEHTSLIREIEAKTNELKSLSDSLEKTKEDLSNIEKTLEEKLALLEEKNLFLEELTLKNQNLADRLSLKEDELSKLTVEKRTVENKIEQIKNFLENREGFSENVKKLIKEKGELIKGVLGDFIESKDVNTNFFENLISSFYQVIVPKDKKSFDSLVSYCKKKGYKGIGIALPEEEREFTPEERTLSEYIVFENGIPKKLKRFLGYISVEPSEKGFEKSFVLLNGDYYFADRGIYFTGSHEEGGFLSLKNQLKKNILSLESINIKIEKLEQEIAELKEEKNQLLSMIYQAEEETESIKEEVAVLKGNLRDNKNKEQFTMSQIEKLKSLLEKLNQNKKSVEEQIKGIENQIGELNKSIEDKLSVKDKKTGELDRLKEQFEYMQEEYNDVIILLEKRQSNLKSIEKELEFIIQRKEELNQRIEKAKEDRVRDTKNIAIVERKIDDLREEGNRIIDEYREISDILRNKKELLEREKQELSLLERKVFELKKSEEELNKLKQEKEIKKAELSAKFENLKDYAISKFGTFKSEQAENIEELNEKFEKLSARLNNFGAINLLAIEECDEQEKRYNFLMEQKKDLEKSIKNLTRDIKEIDQTTKTLFLNAFDFINAKFGEIFQALFGGGKAYLKLSDEENILETGVEIYAKVPGETVKRITLLSGGEKAKTALALVFALFEYRISPLCVLDEVDAPLDEANVLRFGKFLQRYKDRVQFIVVTHNKTTMELADYIYGITMEEPGCSKVFSIKLEDFS